jgi:hypothetical protein
VRPRQAAQDVAPGVNSVNLSFGRKVSQQKRVFEAFRYFSQIHTIKIRIAFFKTALQGKKT